MANAIGSGWDGSVPLFNVKLDCGIIICDVPATEILRYGSIGDSIVREYMVQAFAKVEHMVVLAKSVQQLKPKMPSWADITKDIQFMTVDEGNKAFLVYDIIARHIGR